MMLWLTPRPGTLWAKTALPPANYASALTISGDGFARAVGESGTDDCGPSSAQTTTRARQAVQATVSVRSGNSYGAGVVMSNDGLVLTVHHVVKRGDPVWVALAGHDWQQARVVARDEPADLALLHIDLPADGDYSPAPLGSVVSMRPGDELLMVGSPHKLHFSVTRGMVSFVGRRFGAFRYLQTDLPAQPGNSGGPVFDDQGRLVAVMAFIVGRGNLAFAIPIDYALTRFPLLATATGDHIINPYFSQWSRISPMAAD